MNAQRLQAQTAWLRPYTRWAARFALAAPGWLPGFMRHAPLKLSSLILRGYHWALR